jgi:hypothetical protein
VPTDSFRSHFAKSRACRVGGLGIALVKMACKTFHVAGRRGPMWRRPTISKFSAPVNHRKRSDVHNPLKS